MKKLIVLLFILSTFSASYSQWISNYGYKTGDVDFTSSKGNAVVCKGNYSYVTGYTLESGRGNDIVTIKYDSDGDTLWVRGYNGTANTDDEGLGLCVDDDNNIYVVGYAQYTGKSKDAVILKYSKTGVLLWVRPFSVTSNSVVDKGVAITIDEHDYLYITGFTTGSDGNTDIFTQKCDQSGNVQWTVIEDGASNLNAEGTAITVDDERNVYVCGFITVSGTNTDIAVLKYSRTGAQRWMQTVNGNGNSEDKAWGIVVDENDNAYITGYVTTAAGSTDAYTAKFSSSGNLIWSDSYNGNENQSDKAWGIVVDEDKAVFVTGETEDANDNTNYLTLKYDRHGDLTWEKTYNGPGDGEDKSASISLFRNNIVITGKSWGSSSTYDYATIRYKKHNGMQLEVNRYSMAENSNDLAKDVATKGSTVVVTGYSELIMDNAEGDTYISTVSPAWDSNLESDPEVPSGFSLYQNYPNPFNPATSIQFDLAVNSNVKLAVYDVLGKEVSVLVNQQLEAGTHNITFNASNLSSGIYFYRLEAGDFYDIKKMTLVK
jgi:hypothetical protein